ncbi:hypothetical protein CI102_9023 [Trichoderma harzianum]|nr:hypothetical protein CI102_9023 [Trichoderma harzianum]
MYTDRSAWSDVTWPIRAILGIQDARYSHGHVRSHGPPLSSFLNVITSLWRKPPKSRAKKAQLPEHRQALTLSASRYQSSLLGPQAPRFPAASYAAARQGRVKKNLLKENLARAWTLCPGCCSGWCF